MPEETKEVEKIEKVTKTEVKDNVVFIGKKPSMSYVLAVVTQFGEGQTEVHLKARGRAISKAVDVSEIVKNKFISDVKLKDIKIGTEVLEGENKEKINVSTIEMILKK
jgi:DNA-binding protein